MRFLFLCLVTLSVATTASAQTGVLVLEDARADVLKYSCELPTGGTAVIKYVVTIDRGTREMTAVFPKGDSARGFAVEATDRTGKENHYTLITYWPDTLNIDLALKQDSAKLTLAWGAKEFTCEKR